MQDERGEGIPGVGDEGNSLRLMGRSLVGNVRKGPGACDGEREEVHVGS